MNFIWPAWNIEKAASPDSTYTPPAGARGNARKVLQWKEKYGREVKGMTSVGWGRARQLASGKEISLSTVRRMSGFNRHRKNYAAARAKQKREGGKPWQYAGIVAWLGWGGNSGMAWAKRVSAVNKRWGGEASNDHRSSPLAEFSVLLKALSDRKYVRDKGGRFAHTGSVAVGAHEESERVKQLREKMTDHEKNAAAAIHRGSSLRSRAIADYQSAYDVAYKDVSKIRRKLLAADYRQTKRLEKFNNQVKMHRESMENAASVLAAHMRSEFEKVYKPGMSDSDMEASRARIVATRQYKKLAKPVDNFSKKMKASEAKVKDAQEKERARFLAAIAIPAESRLPVVVKESNKDLIKESRYEVGSSISKEFKTCTKPHAQAAREASEFLSAMLHKDSENANAGSVVVHSLRAGKDGRAYAASNHVALGKNSTTATAVHEIGHVLERDRSFEVLATGFLAKRCGNEVPHVMYRSMMLNRPEYGREDRFGDAFGDSAGYVGKYYRHGATEIFSMGLEKLYTDPVGFAKKDPEYFNFMVGAMSGKIKVPKSV